MLNNWINFHLYWELSSFRYAFYAQLRSSVTAKTDGACPPKFEVSVSDLEFSQTRYGWEFQRFPPKFSSSKKYSREPFNFPWNIQFFIWSLCRCASLRCCCLNPVHHITQDLGCCQQQKAYTFQLLPYKN